MVFDCLFFLRVNINIIIVKLGRLEFILTFPV